MNTLEYAFTADYKADMHRHIDSLYQDAKTANTSRERRLITSDALIEAYYEHSEERPDGNALERLATLILRDELTDNDRMKSRNTEYAILSDDQLGRREDGEISFKWAEEIGTDGRDYKTPTRENMRKLR